ncbi:MAG: TIGR02757 family protein, partial [Muribaculaceae bacterium]|nr:TIGR02757 family protein [Muribaculaceae bacterium]
RNVSKMISLMGHAPYYYVMDRGYEDLDDEGNIHRTFFNRNFKHYLAGLYEIYSRHASLEDFAAASCVDRCELPAWRLAEAINSSIASACGGMADNRCMPQNVSTSALKRLNMALRWLVRDDGIVDLGVWSILRPSQLYIPYDVHVQNTSRSLGLVKRKSVDRRAVEELTATLRTFDPVDPVKYDFALFGLGIEAKNEK